MENRASYILVGSFVLVLVGVLVGVAIWFAGVEFDKKPDRYLVYFSGNVTGLGVGSAVRYRGVPVGSVSDIRIDPKDVERVQVVIEVTAGTPIKKDTVAQLSLQGITGVAFVQLTGGTQGSERLASARRGTPPVIASRQSILQTVTDQLPQITERIVVVADRLIRFFDERNIDAVTKTLENLQQASGNLTAGMDDFKSFVSEGRSAAQQVREAAENTSRLTKGLGDKIAPLATTASESFVEFRKALVAVRKGITSLDKVASDIEDVVDKNKRPIHDFANTGLYELSMFLAEARVLVDSLTRLTNRIERDPAQFFFGDSQRGVKAQ